MRILFLGSGEFGLPTLQHLARSAQHTITGIVTQPDRPAGRRRELTPTPIGAWAAENLPGGSVPLFKPENINEPAMLAQVRAVPADAWVIIAFGQKLSRELIDGRFAINLHASLLPRWRGAAPINRAMMAGDTETGNSVITIADRMDAGLVLGTSRRPITPNLTAGELHDLLAADGPALIDQVLREHAAGTTRAITQDESRVTKAAKLSKADGWVDWARPARDCHARIHGLTPWPGVSVTINNEPVKILRCLPATSPPSTPAALGMLTDPSAGLIACGENSALQLLEVQPASGKPMKWPDFTRGRAIAPNTPVISAPPPTQH